MMEMTNGGNSSLALVPKSSPMNKRDSGSSDFLVQMDYDGPEGTGYAIAITISMLIHLC